MNTFSVGKFDSVGISYLLMFKCSPSPAGSLVMSTRMLSDKCKTITNSTFSELGIKKKGSWIKGRLLATRVLLSNLKLIFI